MVLEGKGVGGFGRVESQARLDRRRLEKGIVMSL